MHAHIVAAFLFAQAASASDPGEALREAAAAGDLARVRAQLEAKVPADVPARHGRTALHFAAEKGSLPVVRLLADRGADVNVREAFFGESALEVALRGDHHSVALFLLQRGARDANSALHYAAEKGNLELARAALATPHVEHLELAAARKTAERAGKGPVAALLAKASVPRKTHPPYTLEAARILASAGKYRAGDGAEAVLSLRQTTVYLNEAGKPEVALAPIALDRYESADGTVAVSIGGRGGSVEWMRVNRGGDVKRYNLVTATPQPLKISDAPRAAPPMARAAGRNWPSFRGPEASGVGDGQGVPLTWNLGKGENVRFRTPIPGMGLSSPIVWGDRIFLTTAVSGKGDKTFRTGLYGDPTSVDDLSEHSFRLYALDTASGRILWEREVHKGSPPVRRHLKSSQANATPATDGKRLVVLFGTIGLLAAYDFEGKQLWTTDVGVMEANDPQSGTAQWGHASSPVLYEDLVIVQGDRRKDSFLAAYRLADGKEAWRVARDEASTWSTPAIVRAGTGDELIANGQTIRAYDPRTGRELWTLGPSSEVVVATPVVGEGVAFVTAGYPPVRPVYAVRPGHRGDLTLPEGRRSSEAVAWSHTRGGTYIPTPILYRGLLYTINNNGILTSYRADTGVQVHQTRLGGGATSFAASPVAADGRLYIISENGEVFVLRAGDEPELLVTNLMDETVMSTPALSDGLLVVRTLGQVVGIAEGARLAEARP